MVLAAQRRLRNSAHMKARLARSIGRQVIRHVTIAAKDHGIIPVPKLWITRLGKSNCTTVGTRHGIAVAFACSWLRTSIAASNAERAMRAGLKLIRSIDEVPSRARAC
jgi:hypothetical protein